MTEPRVAVGAVIVRDGKMLVIQRGNEPGAGKWAVPGGMVDPGETMRDALRREIHEEVGLAIEPGGVAWIGELIDGDHHFVLVDFFAEAADDRIAPDPDEVMDARWVEIRDLTKLPLVPTMHDLIRTIWPEL